MRSPRLGRRLLATGVLAGSLVAPALLAASPAGAATSLTTALDSVTGALTVTDAPGASSIRLDCTAAGVVTVKERTVLLRPVGGPRVVSGVTKVIVHAGDGDDFVTAEHCALPTEIDGGPGIDILIGGPGNDVLRNGEGTGTSALNFVTGGGGDDVIEVAAGTQPLFLAGGPGADVLRLDVSGRASNERPFWLPGWSHIEVSGFATVYHTEFEGPVQIVNAPPSTPSTPPSDLEAPVGDDPTVRSGYWMLAADGTVYARNPKSGETFGDVTHHGDPRTEIAFLSMVDHLDGATPTEAVKISPMPSGNGYRVLDNKGRVYSYGDAANAAIKDGEQAEKPRRAGEYYSTMATTASGNGYWLFTNQGRVLAYGDAERFTDPRGKQDLTSDSLNGPIVDSAVTIDGKGYYMLGADGGVFTFGSAQFYGSTGNLVLNSPANGIVPDRDGVGYRFVAGDGGIFAFDAEFYGSLGDVTLNRPINGMVSHGRGYLMVASDGGIFMSNPKHPTWIFSDLPFFGSLGDVLIPSPISSVASLYVVG